MGGSDLPRAQGTRDFRSVSCDAGVTALSLTMAFLVQAMAARRGLLFFEPDVDQAVVKEMQD